MNCIQTLFPEKISYPALPSGGAKVQQTHAGAVRFSTQSNKGRRSPQSWEPFHSPSVLGVGFRIRVREDRIRWWLPKIVTFCLYGLRPQFGSVLVEIPEKVRIPHGVTWQPKYKVGCVQLE